MPIIFHKVIFPTVKHKKSGLMQKDICGKLYLQMSTVPGDFRTLYYPVNLHSKKMFSISKDFLTLFQWDKN